MGKQNSPLVLGTERISKLLTQYAIPAIIAMTASSLYNMVDSIFIGLGVGPMAISGLALTFPLMNLAAAFGSLVGVGAASVDFQVSTGRMPMVLNGPQAPATDPVFDAEQTANNA